MNNTAINLSNISKKYKLGNVHKTELHETLRNLFKRKEKNYKDDNDFWALSDINFSVQKGEAVGIIGKNGAGKSTILKILSRITKPTHGRIEIDGRVASLLEVGTGFNDELTGRENIFLNGTILGMKNLEIRQKLDQIIGFSGVEHFVNTPVKRYSSGMKVRLAFSVAAHLEPEILIIDEVLAVGDVEFQKRCLGKMKEVVDEGRTVLFVSHNMGMIETFCQRGILLDEGEVSFDGSVKECIQEYYNTIEQLSRNKIENRTDRKGSGEVQITNIFLTDIDDKPVYSIKSGQSFKIYLQYEVHSNDFDDLDFRVAINIKNLQNVPLFNHDNRRIRKRFSRQDVNKGRFFAINIYDFDLNYGEYLLSFSIMNGPNFIDGLSDAIKFTVLKDYIYNYKEVPPPSHSLLLKKTEWNII